MSYRPTIPARHQSPGIAKSPASCTSDAPCHREVGTAFPLMTYQDAQPRASAIKDAVLQRRMPPWGAVKGFGDFRNDQGLTAEQLELIVDWEEGGAPEGEEKDLPAPPKPAAVPAIATAHSASTH